MGGAGKQFRCKLNKGYPAPALRLSSSKNLDATEPDLTLGNMGTMWRAGRRTSLGTGTKTRMPQQPRRPAVLLQFTGCGPLS